MRNKIIIKVIISVIVAVVIYKCTITLPLKPYSVFCNSKEDILEGGRSLWVYKPLSDSLVIKDRVRNLRFHIKYIYAYDPKLFDEAYFWLFLPWVKLNNTGNVKYFTVCFDYINIKDKWDFRTGIVINIRDSATTKVWNRHTYDGGWDDSIAGKSYYETKKIALSDTLYLTVWGQKDLFLPYSVYKNLPESERLKTFSSKYENGQVKIGQLTIVKSDSIINHKKRDPIETKLFTRAVRKL